MKKFLLILFTFINLTFIYHAYTMEELCNPTGDAQPQAQPTPNCRQKCCLCCLKCLKKTYDVEKLLIPITNTIVTITAPEVATIVAAVNVVFKISTVALIKLVQKCVDENTQIEPGYVPVLHLYDLTDDHGSVTDNRVRALVPYLVQQRTVRGEIRVNAIRSPEELYRTLSRRYTEVTIVER